MEHHLTRFGSGVEDHVIWQKNVVNETSPLTDATLYWLFRQKHSDQFWFADTPIVLMAFVRFLKREARLVNALKKMIPCTCS